MDKTIKAQKINMINEAFFKLDRACEHTRDWDKYIQLHETEEKEHRRFKPAGLQCGLTRKQSIRLFMVQRIFERFVSPRESEKIFTPTAADFFTIKPAVFGACALAEACKDRILQQFGPNYMRNWLDEIDYAELNK